MKRLFISTLGFMLMFSRAGAQTPVFDNEGIFSYIMPPQAAPQIDAPIFINHGQFNISNYYTFSTAEGLGLAQAALPFESSNTRIYTNTFLMTGDPGLRLDRFDTSAGRSFPADLIVNAPSANVDSATMFGDWELTLNATNIINRGILAIGESGHLVLDAPDTIDLARSTLTTIGTDIDPAAYTKPLYWGANRSGIFGVGLVPGFPQSFDPTAFTAPTLATTWATPIGGVYPYDSFYFPTNGFFDFINGFSTYQQEYTQGDGKLVVESLFLSQTNPAISSAVQFFGFGGWGSVKIVRFEAFETNRVTGEIYTNQLYVHDLFPALDDQYLGLGQNTPLDIYWAVYNLQNVMKTYVPGEVLTNALFGIGSSGTPTGHGITNLYVLDGGVFPITRSPLFYLPFGAGNDQSPTSFDPFWFEGTNVPPSVTNAVLGMRVNASAWMPDASVQGSTFSNLVGRIDINAGKVLDLTRVRIDGSSFLNIRATNHFVGSSNAVIMSPYSQFDLRTTNVTMNVANLTTPTIPRINGTIDIWSARWTNNAHPTLGGPGVVYHVTVIDSHLDTDAPSQITSFTAHAKNLVLSDQLNIFSNLFLPDTVALTITTNGPTGATDTGGINLSSGDLVWSSSFPHLLYVTNYGTIQAANTLYLSTTPYPPNFYPGQTAYWTFINHGTVFSEGQQIYADYVLSDGLQSA
ncbi:MAG TPA: hypothetical protein VG897_04810, partial [Terriglobales bacterium]|nr:hypothetical protein [Terriglobales bacterium]